MAKSAKRKAHEAKKTLNNSDLLRLKDIGSATHLPPPYEPIVVDDTDMVFGGRVRPLMPKMEDIPEQYKKRGGPYDDLVTAWFYGGLKQIIPKRRDGGLSTDVMLRHIRTILVSFQPKHEHKTAAIRFLLDTWFESVYWVSK